MTHPHETVKSVNYDAKRFYRIGDDLVKQERPF
jgi:hypothetical protein